MLVRAYYITIAVMISIYRYKSIFELMCVNQEYNSGIFLVGYVKGRVKGQFCLIKILLLFIFGNERKSVDPIIVSREYFRWGMKFPTHFVYSYK